MKRARIGLLGGTFNPVHFGHIQLAHAALRECHLDRVVFIPAAHPPHKDGSRLLPFHHRVAMLELVIGEGCPFSCCTIENQMAPPTYTIDTLRAFRDSCPVGDLYFIIGSDAFLELVSWKSYSRILSMVEIVLARRAGDDPAEISAFLEKMGYVQHDGTWRGRREWKDVHLLQTTPAPCSSSLIRQRLCRGQSVAEFLPEQVNTYIKVHRLYQRRAAPGSPQGDGSD